jgi:hypothetical protein
VRYQINILQIWTYTLVNNFYKFFKYQWLIYQWSISLVNSMYLLRYETHPNITKKCSCLYYSTNKDNYLLNKEYNSQYMKAVDINLNSHKTFFQLNFRVIVRRTNGLMENEQGGEYIDYPCATKLYMHVLPLRPIWKY